MASSYFCSTPRHELEPPTLTRQNSGIGDAYSVAPSAHSVATVSRYHDEPEVNYDEGPTELYKRIEEKDWEGASVRLESHPFEAKTWVYRKEHSSNKMRWRLLPIHATCIFRAPLGLIEALIDIYRDGPQMKDDQGMLPIHLACRNGGSKGVILALLNGFPDSCKVTEKKGRTPLELVLNSESQNTEAVSAAIRTFEQQLQKNEKLRIVNMTPDVDAIPQAQEVDYEHRTVLFRLLLKKDWNGAIQRAESNPEEAATWIVTKGFNGNLRFLPLHKACVLCPPGEVVEKLLKAYPEGSKCRDQDGWLPIHCACFYGACGNVITALLEVHPKGSQLKDDEGRLPIHYACLKSASQEVVNILLENFPKGGMSKDDEGRLPIHHACSKGAPEGVIDALLKASGKGAQSKDDQGRLPLHHACRKSLSERIVRTLIRVYPRATQIKDDQDKLPIHYACQNGSSPNVVNILLTTFPESINVKNGFGYTPLAEATSLESSKMEPIIHILQKFKQEQDKLKADSGENCILEAKLEAMGTRVEHLEKLLRQVMDIGHEIKGGVKRGKDPIVLVNRLADRIIALDGSTSISDSFCDDSYSSDQARKARSRSRGPFGRKNKKKHTM
mmetsp:Transcript_25693/g.56345  ORF Transcript_25693/g.56345 Transcript_25693/m.56345 type:complete len:614 (+) Transcript_25693:95-1936(+)|eukprot:CAMPEP_0168187220 /NCGR_PEP_ID=MMETSP0139_2-20121125/14907_1 /TAXON_ID=44445 /ORGANISM="Pseudo-nitzschia australis, Strain 10249 10 AB" /LENGTH=613 /DNA_ID=CAMNT_0008109395 /DNA_START=17 /DNA_END=1858 /DNA_ORIENTATION=-